MKPIYMREAAPPLDGGEEQWGGFNQKPRMAR